MKIRKINILLALTVGAVVTLGSCTKDDGAIPSRVTVVAVPVISTNVDKSVKDTIFLSNTGAFAGKFVISNYFPGKPLPDKVDLVIRRNAATTSISNANVKLYKTNAIATYPATFTITAAEIKALFGAAFVANEVYDVAPDLYVGDSKYQAFPTGLTGTGAGVAAMPLYGEFARFIVKP